MSNLEGWVPMDNQARKQLGQVQKRLTLRNHPSDEMVLDAIERFWDRLVENKAAPYPYQDEELRKHYSEQEIYDHMEDMADRDILDYGVSLRTAWIRFEHAAGRSRNAVEGR